MSNCGLTITEEEFLSLPNKQQMLLVFKNQEETKRLVEGYKFWYKLNATITTTLTAGVVYLFNLQFAHIFIPLVVLFLFVI